MAETLFIVDPLPDERSRIMTALADENVAIEVYESGAQFLDQVTANASGCVVAPIDLPGIGLRALIAEINRRDLPLAVVVIGRDSELDSAVELVRAGRFRFSRASVFRSPAALGGAPRDRRTCLKSPPSSQSFASRLLTDVRDDSARSN